MTSKRIREVRIYHVLDEDGDSSYLGEYSNRPKNEFAIDRAHSEDCASVMPINKQAQQMLINARGYVAEIQSALPTPDDIEWNALEEAYYILDMMAEGLRDCDCDWHVPPSESRYFNPSTVEPFNPSADWLKDATDKKKYWYKAMRENAKADYERMELLNAGHWYYMGIYAEADVQTSVSAPIQTLRSGGLWGIESDSGQDYIESLEQDELITLKAELRAIGFSTRAISTAFKSIVRKER